MEYKLQNFVALTYGLGDRPKLTKATAAVAFQECSET